MIKSYYILSLLIGTNTVLADGLDDVKKGFDAASRGEYEMAIFYYTEAIDSMELSQESLTQAYHNRGMVHSIKGQYDRAIQDFDQTILLNPQFVFAYGNRGRAYYLKGQYD